jgi:uncharacterized protein YbgA (DUF1722 family)/uncharacterized protein YbbK (DUF523 family)
MRTFPTPIVVLSQCLEKEACRYNAQVIRDDFVRELEPFVRYVTVCPEVEIGLGVPRDPIRLVRIGEARPLLVQPATSRDLTEAMTAFSERFLGALPAVDGFVLKNRSPSCGIKDVKMYSAPAGGPPTGTGPGLFAGAVLERFGGRAIEDEGRLRNPHIRDHFLTQLFTLAAFRELRAEPAMAGLVEFHARNKLLLMAHNQAAARALGTIVGNPGRRPVTEVFAAYEVGLGRALARPARPGPWINVAQHAFGFFSRELTTRERTFFGTLLERFRAERQPLSAVLGVLAGWVARFETTYLEAQSFFEPYPHALMRLEHR